MNRARAWMSMPLLAASTLIGASFSAPARYLSMMMGLWLAISFSFSGFLAGYLGSFWSVMDKGSFFMMIAVIAALAGFVILAFVRPLRPILKN